jgi:hypothetical protein
MLKIFHILFKEQDRLTATCLGLASRRYYPILKDLYPNPINNLTECLYLCNTKHRCDHSILQFLFTGECDYVTLQHLLTDFMGPKYRYGGHGSWPFLNREKYGDDWGGKEKMLRQRWDSYEAAQALSDHIKFCGESIHLRFEFDLFPRPFGKGEEWYLQALPIIQRLERKGGDELEPVRDIYRDIQHHDGFIAAKQRMVEEALGEWIELVGF